VPASRAGVPLDSGGAGDVNRSRIEARAPLPATGVVQEAKMFSYRSFWKKQKYHLDEMTMRDLLVVFYQYPAIVAYHVLVLAAVVAFLAVGRLSLGTFLWAAVGAVNVSFTWYLFHRFILHSSLMYRTRWTAALWKRLHYDHHSDPNDLRVLFGALSTTVPPMIIVSSGVFLATGNPGHALAFFGATVAMTIWNELCHCVQHLGYVPKSRYLLRIKRLHLIHHFKNESVYYGITNFFWDRLFGTYPRDVDSVPRSATVFNLGYSKDVQQRYPWVARLTPSSPSTS
jgi:sterol desaturase/sphingolipid hydroxylase (fatty acid hydroxylase superfamily)